MINLIIVHFIMRIIYIIPWFDLIFKMNINIVYQHIPIQLAKRCRMYCQWYGLVGSICDLKTMGVWQNPESKIWICQTMKLQTYQDFLREKVKPEIPPFYDKKLIICHLICTLIYLNTLFWNNLYSRYTNSSVQHVYVH